MFSLKQLFNDGIHVFFFIGEKFIIQKKKSQEKKNGKKFEEL